MIAALTPSTIYIKQCSGHNDYGEPTLDASGTAVFAAIDENIQMVKDDKGELVQSVASVIFAADTTISDGMQISLDGTTYYDVIRLSKPRDFWGNVSHYHAYI